MIEATVSRRGP